jgi:hypothetical protein
MRNQSFWNESVEEAMGCDMHVGDDGRTKSADSDTPNQPYRSDTYYARSHIAQLPIHEKSAEELVSSHVVE